MAGLLMLSLHPTSSLWAARKTSADYTVEADVLAGSGDWGIAGVYYNNSTLAQTTSISWQTSADYANRQGYWGISQYNPTVVRLKEFTAQGFDGMVAINWETGAEIDNLGFHLYRAESAAGSYTRITDRLILVLGAHPTGGRYLFLDHRVDNGKTYYYKLEDIDFTGASKLHGPVEAIVVADGGEFSYDSADYAMIVENNELPSPPPFSTPKMPCFTPAQIPTPPAPLPTPFPIPHSPFPIIDFADYNGDGTSDIAVFLPSSGLWAVRGITRCYFGAEEDIPANGDYNGDGTADIAVFRGSDGLWAVRHYTRTYFGTAGDIPVPADYDGDGKTEIALFRSRSGLWAIRELTRCYFGGKDDLAGSGDYNGDGTGDIVIRRISSGLWAIRQQSRFYFGRADDIPVPSDYDGDWTDDPAIFRPGSGLWAIRNKSQCYLGEADDIPVPADYDGDGRGDIGVFRKRNGLWAIRDLSRCYFGTRSEEHTSELQSH